jgi:hypothetical protein
LPLVEPGSGTRENSMGYGNAGGTLVLQQPRRNNWPLMVVGAGLLVLGLGLSALAMVNINQGAESKRGVAPFPAAQADNGGPATTAGSLEKVMVKVSATPSQAKLYLDGISVLNPYSLRFDVDGVKHHIRAEADGYESEERYLVFKTDETVVLQLSKQVAGKEQDVKVVPRLVTRRKWARRASPVSHEVAEKATETEKKASSKPAEAPKVQVIEEPEVNIIE